MFLCTLEVKSSYACKKRKRSCTCTQLCSGVWLQGSNEQLYWWRHKVIDISYYQNKASIQLISLKAFSPSAVSSPQNKHLLSSPCYVRCWVALAGRFAPLRVERTRGCKKTFFFSFLLHSFPQLTEMLPNVRCRWNFKSIKSEGTSCCSSWFARWYKVH